MYLVAYDSARSANQASALLLITVERNPSSPRFVNPTLSFTVNEREPIGFRINQLTATDLDARDVISYSVAPGYTNGTLMFFYLNEQSVILTVASDLRDSRPYGNQYQFQVIANDQGKPPKSAFLSVTIFVERDEFPPFFSPPQKNETITDKHLTNTFVSSVFADDRDRKGTIVYELVGDGNAMAYFSIDRATGFINLIKDIKTTRDTVFRLVLQAYDSFYPTNRATMYMYIFVQRNSDIIVFDTTLSYFVEVNEYRQLFNEIYRVSATDPDGDSVSYRISTNPLAQEYFFIATEGKFGVLYIKKSLSLNQLNYTYVFLIEARDNRQFDTQTSTKQMTVRVLRNQRPVILNIEREITVDERRPIGERIYVIGARDPDLLPGSVLHYQVYGESLAPGLFEIVDIEKGFITVASNLMRDKAPAYNLTVVVYDFELPDLMASYTIRVTMIRNANAPVFTSNPYRSNLELRDLPGKIVATISATDADNDRVTYSLGSNLPEVADYFRVNSDNGNIVLLRTLPARRESFTINVQARDNASPEKFAQSSVELTIEIDRFGPVFEPENTIISMATEDTRPVGTVIGAVTARDGDRRGQIVYEVVGEYPGDNFFGVNSTTGQVYIITNLMDDALARSLYTIYIDAYDSLVPDNRARTQVQITVLRNQGFPEFDRASYNEQIDEFHQLAVSVVNITARDTRDNDQITYRMIDGSLNQINSQFFYIEPSTGVIYLRKPLTESTVDSFSFRVEATDDGLPARSRDVSVVFSVIRVGLPTFSPPFAIDVPEDKPTGQSIFRVNAQNPISGRNPFLRYELIGLPPANYFFVINHTTGDISVNRSLRNGDLLEYRLQVKVYDEATPTRASYQTITVSVRRNIYPPKIAADAFDVIVYDTDPIGKEVVLINATDADNDPLVFTILGDARCLSAFRIESSVYNYGAIYVNTDLRSTTGNFQCTVQVSDGGFPVPQTDTALVNINVIRAQPPVFVPPPGNYIRPVREDQPLNSNIIDLDAPKPDARGQVVYELVGDFPSPYFFQVNRTTGVITQTNDLRYDSLGTNPYIIKVVAYDSAVPSVRSTATVTVSVERNLNGPRVVPPSVTINASQDSPVHSWGYLVNVTDPDSRNPTCSIIGTAVAQEFFKIDPKTCLITLRKSLLDDPLFRDIYEITVKVNDNGVPEKFSTGQVIVLVPRDLQNPVLNLPTTVTVLETALIGSNVFNVDATDGDQKGNLVYRIEGVFPDMMFFNIDATGQITLRNSLMSDSQQDQSYTVVVEVYDDFWPSNKHQGTLTVNVNRNPSSPVFSQPNGYFRTINADFPVGNVVLTVNATDSDQRNPFLRYELIGLPPANNFFVINSTTGDISVNRSLRNDDLLEYRLQVKVYDVT
ncbi:hypothetical protein DPMN_025838 [Dreissena polymorpha]|uniref:Cadherin domain-containing protein n=2 Tax=Dreissena polymorpha TaxID=45954 RepID=A0A9D4LS88_DREPO|nr:hypothetical protein DPMN_025838 [Dreissena polymorpha]